MSTSQVLIGLILASFAGEAPDTPLTLRGRVICMEEADGVSEDHMHRYSFKTEQGRVRPLYRSITSEALFVDTRLHEHLLEVVGRLREDRLLEVYQIRSIHDGVVHEVYYWCDVCAIRSTAPGPCWCCYLPFELKEIPISGKD